MADQWKPNPDHAIFHHLVQKEDGYTPEGYRGWYKQQMEDTIQNDKPN
ncbi:hypothetical protein J2TS4_09000 [Paenibacillus sp. J2TS4]|nr:hypothetical protein J2TS4_09000 [Paenibacillus sp. J2TS4]